MLETNSPYLPSPEAEDTIPSLAHVYHVAERVRALRDEISVQAILRAGHEATCGSTASKSPLSLPLYIVYIVFFNIVEEPSIVYVYYCYKQDFPVHHISPM